MFINSKYTFVETTLKAGGLNLKVRTDKSRSSAMLVVRTFAHPLFFLFSVCLSDRQPPPIHRCRKIGQLCRLCRLFWAISPIFDARHCAGSSGFPVWAETLRGRCGGVLWSRVMIMIVRLSMCFARFYNFTCSHSVCQCVLLDFTFHNFTFCEPGTLLSWNILRVNTPQ